MTDITLLLTLLLLFFILMYFISQYTRPAKFPPGPQWMPFVGNSHLLKSLSIFHGGFHKALIHLSNSYKTSVLGLRLGGDLYVIVFTRDLIKQVFTEDEFQARPDSYFIRLRTMGSKKGITMTDGSFWQEQRSFAVKHLRSLGFGKKHMESLIIEELKDLLKTINAGGDSVVVSNKFPPCVVNVLWALVAGSRFPSSDSQLTRLLDLLAARTRAFDLAGGVLSQLPFLAHLAPEWSGYNLICSLNSELKSLLEKTIEDHKKTLDMNKTRDFIDAYLKEIETLNGHSHSFTEEQLIMVCLDFFIAGSHTTSNTLSFALLHMILNPEIQERAYAEIRTVFGERKIPSLEDRPRLPFVEAVLTESQRFLHVAPVAGPRRVLCDTTLGEYRIPKGTTILSSLYSVHHDKNMWEEPMRFNPDRFMEEKNRKLMDELCLFGLGKRRCPGEALAKNFILLFFTGILRNFHLGIKSGTDSPSFDFIPGITLSPKPFNVYLTPRQT